METTSFGLDSSYGRHWGCRKHCKIRLGSKIRSKINRFRKQPRRRALTELEQEMLTIAALCLHLFFDVLSVNEPGGGQIRSRICYFPSTTDTSITKCFDFQRNKARHRCERNKLRHILGTGVNRSAHIPFSDCGSGMGVSLYHNVVGRGV